MPEIKPVALPRVQTGIPATLSYELLARRPDLQAMRWYVQASLDQGGFRAGAVLPEL